MSQDTISLDLELRDTLGKAVKHIRTSGKVPAVIHDHGKSSIHVQGEYVAMSKVWKQAGKHHPVELTANGIHYTALIKDAGIDPRKNRLIHVVFNAVDKNQTVEAEIPIHPRFAEGNEASPAERAGLIVLEQLDVVEVRALASKLPDFIEYDAEVLVNVGDHVTVADLIVPDGVEIETEAEHAVATVYEPGALAAANDAAGGTAEEAAPTEETVEGEAATSAAETEKSE